jgi:N-acetylneuraminate lyase
MGLAGIFAALVTPFGEDDAIDQATTARLVEFQVRQGLAGFYVGGSSGEAMLQSMAERAEFLRLVVDINAGRLKLIAHVGAIATADVLRLAEVAHATGDAAIAAITPFYYHFSGAEITAHYLAIAEPAALPLFIYNFPAIAKGFTIDEFDKLLAHPKIVGVKHTSSDLFALERLTQRHPQAIIFNGYDEMCLAGLVTGGHGAIGTTCNFKGDLFVAIAARVAAGELAAARDQQRTANTVIETAIALGAIPATKAILELMGAPVGVARRPFRRLTSAELARLQRAIEPVIAWRERRRP